MKVKVLVTQSCLTLSNSMDYSAPGSVHGSFQAPVICGYWLLNLGGSL